MHQKVIDAFESKVIRRGEEECWGWSGGRHQHGYGQMNIGGRVFRAHRVAYERVHGAVPHGLDVMHSCHNPECSNPKHLAVGSRKQNMQTSMNDGRMQRKIPRTEMPLIFEMRAAGWKYQELANLYGCTLQAVRHMMRAHPELRNA